MGSKWWKLVSCWIVIAGIVCCSAGDLAVGAEDDGQESVETHAETAEEKLNLYALSAVLMDGESGRVLYEKDGFTKRAMASTTKIMTLIIALEYGKLDDIVTVSKYAASMPDVQLNIKTGEMFYLKDLLYSLMLESHNDSAVAIAEHIGGSVEGFAKLMNDKAKELGCNDTYFITPNGLDAGEGDMIHSTTARDLAVIMSYCIKNQEFLNITRTLDYSFSNKKVSENGEVISGGRSYSVTNRNALLRSMDGIISGKTGFTGDAGYCYVCAFENEDRTYIVALLGCGWPNNKNYKWADTKKLLEYGMKNFTKKDMYNYDMTLDDILVENGVCGEYYDFGTEGINADKRVYISPYVEEAPINMLCKEGETIEYRIDIVDKLKAPISIGQEIGSVKYIASGGIEKVYKIYAGRSVKEKNFTWSFGCAFMKFILH